MRRKTTLGLPAVLLLALWVLPLLQIGCASRQATVKQLERLQGHWEGEGREGNGPKFRSSLAITGNSLRFTRDSNYWFETTFTLPAGTGPQRMDATIKASSYPSHIGEVVVAIFKMEGRVLTLAASDHGETPKDFDDESNSLFVLRKVQIPRVGVEASPTR